MADEGKVAVKQKAGEGALAPKVKAATAPPKADADCVESDTEPRVDPVFQTLLCPQTPEERAALEAQLLEDGECRDPLVVWEGHGILLDGHNRLAICKTHGLGFAVKRISLPDREAAEAWIVDNQMARRNLLPEMVSYLRGRRLRGGVRQGERDGGASGQDVRKTAAHRIAAEFKVDEKTIRRDGDFARSLDVLAENCGDEIRRKVLSREVKVPRSRLRKLAEMLPSEQRRLVPELLAGGKPARKPRAAAPQEALARAWKKLKDGDRHEAIEGLLAQPDFAAMLEGVRAAQTVSAPEEGE